MNFAATASIFLPLFLTGCDLLFPPCTNYKREVCTCDDAGAAMCKVAEAVEKQAKKYKDNDDDAKYDSLQDTCEKSLEAWDKADGCDQFSGGGGGGGGGGGDGDGDGDGDGESDAAESCSFGDQVCIEPNEPSNMDWCYEIGGSYSEDSCPGGEVLACELPSGGDFSASATAYYYNVELWQAEQACWDSGGTIQ